MCILSDRLAHYLPNLEKNGKHSIGVQKQSGWHFHSAPGKHFGTWNFCTLIIWMRILSDRLAHYLPKKTLKTLDPKKNTNAHFWHLFSTRIIWLCIFRVGQAATGQKCKMGLGSPKVTKLQKTTRQPTTHPTNTSTPSMCSQVAACFTSREQAARRWKPTKWARRQGRALNSHCGSVHAKLAQKQLWAPSASHRRNGAGVHCQRSSAPRSLSTSPSEGISAPSSEANASADYNEPASARCPAAPSLG